METTVLKAKFHQLIEKVENETLLEALYEVMQEAVQPETGVWEGLTVEARQHVLDAYEESLDESNLLSHSSVQEKYRKWR